MREIHAPATLALVRLTCDNDGVTEVLRFVGLACHPNRWRGPCAVLSVSDRKVGETRLLFR